MKVLTLSVAVSYVHIVADFEMVVTYDGCTVLLCLLAIAVALSAQFQVFKMPIFKAEWLRAE